MLQVRILPGLGLRAERGAVVKREKSVRRLLVFMQDCYAELKKVTWPSREEVGASTRVVLASVAIFAALLGAMDFLFLRGINLLF